MKPMQRFLQALEERTGQSAHGGCGSGTYRCPAHGDECSSLSVTEMDTGNVRLKCFAGCNTIEICNAVGLRQRDLFINH